MKTYATIHNIETKEQTTICEVTKMTDYININGIAFETKKSTLEHFNEYTKYAESFYCKKTLEQCYEKPSQAKQAIFREWYDWFTELNQNSYKLRFDATHFRIVSFNVFQFSLGVALWRDDFPFAILRITRAHNIAYLVQ